MQKKQFSGEFAGRKLEIEFSDMTEQANGSALVRYGDTVVLATATMSTNTRDGLDFFPLSVDYEEKHYAVGKILGSRFLRREARATDNATLNGRIIDRTIRPLFNSKMRNDIQVIATILSYDEENSPDVPAILATSLALSTSDIPWNGPIAGARVIKKGDKFILNPTRTEREGSELDTLICAKDGKINMVETVAYEASEGDAIKAFEEVMTEINKINEFQKKIIKEMSKEKITPNIPEEPKGARDLFAKQIESKLKEYIYIKEKGDRSAKLRDLEKEWYKIASEAHGEEAKNTYIDIWEEVSDDIIHKNVLEKDLRPDHRKLNEVRSLYAGVGILPRAHGSGLFYRGQTHLLSVVTLGSPADNKLLDGIEVNGKKHFLHQYNFPPYSVGEVKPMRGPGRRDIGHGALAEKALFAIIPEREKFPYTIRIVSETMSSNGSSSMASVCASTLALMDAGVPIKNPVAGIAMGLIMKDDKEYKVLTDIQGPEDHYGDMDFKVAGTKTGLTAIQMDVKIEGVTMEMLKVALNDAKVAREHILETMLKTLDVPRKEMSPFAPKIITHHIDPKKIGTLIGPGGKTINGIIDATGAQIDIDDDGSVYITSTDQEAAQKALKIVEGLTKEFKVGEVIETKVNKIFDFGAMVAISPNQNGLIHISKLAPHHINKVTDVVNIGDKVKVKIIKIDEKGRIDLALEP